MKKTGILTFCVIAVMMATFVIGATDYHKNPSSQYLGSAYAGAYSNRTSGTISNFIAAVAGRLVTFVVDGGTWDVTNSIVIPPTMTIIVMPDSTLNISTNITLGFDGGSFYADHTNAFSGSGTATGTARFVYRKLEWGSTNLYNIGPGDINPDTRGGNYVTTNNFKMWVTNFWPLIDTNYVDDVTTNLYDINGGLVLTSNRIAQTMIDAYPNLDTNRFESSATTTVFSVFCATNVTLGASSALKIPFDTETVDNGSDYDLASSNRYDVPTNGFYLFNASAYTESAGGWAVRCDLYKNGSVFRRSGGQSGTNGVADGSWGPISATNGDYFEIFLEEQQGDTPVMLGGSTNNWFEGYKL